MADVFDVLRQDHEQTKQLLTDLRDGPTAATGAASEELRARKQLADRLIITSTMHEATEERYFWPAVRQRVPDGGKLADQAMEQEQEARQALNALGALTADAPNFEPLLAKIIDSSLEHIAFEEERVWPELRQAISTEEALRLGDKIASAETAGPAHPSTVSAHVVPEPASSELPAVDDDVVILPDDNATAADPSTDNAVIQPGEDSAADFSPGEPSRSVPDPGAGWSELTPLPKRRGLDDSAAQRGFGPGDSDQASVGDANLSAAERIDQETAGPTDIDQAVQDTTRTTDPSNTDRTGEHTARTTDPSDIDQAAQDTTRTTDPSNTDRADGELAFQERWRSIQSSFVDDPRQSVAAAADLTAEAVSAFTSSAQERERSLRGEWDRDGVDTECLRNTLRDYRSLLSRLQTL